MQKLSIIIPVYNVEKYIVRCLQSIVEQECEYYEIECLLIDDCSPDQSMDQATHFIANYRGHITFVILHQKHNKGQSAARNEAIRHATGDYIFFLDSDDYLHPGSLLAMVNALNCLPMADFVEGGYHSGKDGCNYPAKGEFRKYNNRKEMLKDLYSGKVSHLACNKLIRRKLIIDHSLFFIEGIIFEDIQWTHRLYHCASSAIVIPNVTYEYVYNPSSTSNTPHVKATKSVNSFAFVLNSFLDTPEDDIYVGHKLFVFHYMLNALDIQLKSTIDKEAFERLLRVKRRLFWQALQDGRIVLSIFFLLTFKPFCYLLKTKIIRHRIHMMEKCVGILANFFNCFHCFHHLRY